MKIGLLLIGSVGGLLAVMVLLGVPANCSIPGGMFWHIQTGACRMGTAPTEPSVVYAIPLAIVLAAWLKRKLSRA